MKRRKRVYCYLCKHYKEEKHSLKDICLRDTACIPVIKNIHRDCKEYKRNWFRFL
jgi:hypothetical protein